MNFHKNIKTFTRKDLLCTCKYALGSYTHVFYARADRLALENMYGVQANMFFVSESIYYVQEHTQHAEATMYYLPE